MSNWKQSDSNVTSIDLSQTKHSQSASISHTAERSPIQWQNTIRRSQIKANALSQVE
jgi:hypothetical protein